MSFQFTREGTVYRVHTEVGTGPTRVVVEENQPQQAPESIDSSEEPANG